MTCPDFKTDLPTCAGVDPDCHESNPHPLDSVQAPAEFDKAGKLLKEAVPWPEHLAGWIYDHRLGAYFCPACAPKRETFDFLQGTDAERALTTEQRTARVAAVAKDQADGR
jgi:hypothetical protein